MKSVLKPVIKYWFRQYKKQYVTPSVRAIFIGDTVSTEVVLHGLYERYELQALEQYVFSNIRKTSNCLDVGANIGNHTSQFSKHFKKVYSFEPNPVVQLILRANTLDKNVEVIGCGVSNQKDTLPFMQNFANLGSSRIADTDVKNTRTIEVDSLDNIARERDIKDVSFMKIDVEGHEQQAIEGALEFLKREQPIIAMESFFQQDRLSGKNITELLRDVGYEHIYEFVPKSHLTRMIGGSPFKSLLLWVIPAGLRKTLKIRKIDTLEGADCFLTLISCTALTDDQSEVV